MVSFVKSLVSLVFGDKCLETFGAMFFVSEIFFQGDSDGEPKIA